MNSGTSAVERARRGTASAVAAPADPPAAQCTEPTSAAQVLGLALLGGLLLWAALPPANLSALSWVAPVPWLWLVLRPRLAPRRTYLALWIAGSVHWLAVLQGIRLPYWALYFGWAALSLYLAVYLPLFVGLARVAVHQWRWPLWVAAPVAWTGLELARGHMVTGFSGALLGHTLVEWLPLIQISDVFGAYGVSFLVMLMAAGITETAAGWKQRRRPRVGLIVACGAVGLAVFYGMLRMQPAGTRKDAPGLSVAMLQGTYDTIFEYNPQRSVDMFEQYLGLAQKASRENPELELLLWPESTFTENNPNWIVGGKLPRPDELSSMTAEEYQRKAEERAQSFLEKARYVADQVNVGRTVPLHQIVGVETVDLRHDPAPRYNSALWLDPKGNPAGRYDKMHLVMFGEYIPLAEWIPWLYTISPMGGGTAVGEGPEVFTVGGLRFAPSVCFESFVPHLIRRHLVELERRGTPADVLVNLTHDGWFWGSSILDLHRTCAVFRAVEHRKTMLTAANPGLTAWIDSDGRIVRELERHHEAYLVANVHKETRTSLYRRIGDWPAGVCLVCVIAMAMAGIAGRRKRP